MRVKTEQPECRFCGGAAGQQAIKGEYVYGGKEGQHFWQCSDCQMIYLYPALSPEEEDKFYREEFEKYMSQRAGQDMDWTGPEKHFQSNQREVRRRMAFLEPHIRKGQKVLEIGCSSGFMLSALREKGLEVCGVDPSGGFVDFVRAMGIDVYKSLDELNQKHDTEFDIVLHYFVLEHIADPVAFISQYLNLIVEGGKMIFEVPCATDPLVELYQVPAFDKFYWSVAHNWYFNKESLSKVLEKVRARFRLSPQQRYDISNHMVWMLEGKPGGMGKYDHVFGETLNEMYKQRLREQWLCDTIAAVIEKCS